MSDKCQACCGHFVPAVPGAEEKPCDACRVILNGALTDLEYARKQLGPNVHLDRVARALDAMARVREAVRLVLGDVP